MRVKQLRLVGYKRFHDLTIELGANPKRIIALVGPNGCGKSSVLDGMIFHSSAYRQIGERGTKGYEYHSLNKQADYNFNSVQIAFENGDDYSQARSKKTSSGKENTIFSLRTSYRYNSHLKIPEIRAMPDIRLNSLGASAMSDLDTRMEENYRRLHAKFTRYMQEEDCPPSVARSHIIGALNRSIQSCLELTLDNVGNIEANEGTLYFSKPDHSRSFDFNVLSSGEKEVIDILLDIYLRADEFNDSVYLIDEPELHINTSVQRKLLIEIERLVPENCQIWISTHSIGFLRALQDDFKDVCDVVEFQPGLNLASAAHVLHPMQKTRANWQRIFHTALDDLTSLLAPQCIIYCEGTLKNSLDETMFNEIFSAKFDNVLFVAGGGKADAERYAGIALTVINKAFSGVAIKLVLDRDDEKADAVVPKGSGIEKIKLQRREFENYLFDLDVLKASYPTIPDEEYHKIVSDIINDDVKSVQHHIQDLCGEKDSKVFKLNLARNFPITSPAYLELESIIFG